jgi:small subunit ribosomal protein S7
MAKKKSKNQEDKKDPIKDTDDETPTKDEKAPVEEKKSEKKDPKIIEDSKKDQKDVEKITDTETLAKKSIKKLVSSKSEIKLFNRWSFENLEVNDPSLLKYINLQPIIIPHSGGKHEHKRFWKTERVSIVERFINKMLAPGLIGRRIKGRNSSNNSGKKQKALKIVENSFSIIEKTSQKNPIQVLVDAVINSAPREETTRISLGGISYATAVDISPQRRVDLGIKLLVQAAVGSTYNNLKTIDECVATELLLAAQKSQNSKAVRRRDEIERIAISAR